MIKAIIEYTIGFILGFGSAHLIIKYTHRDKISKVVKEIKNKISNKQAKIIDPVDPLDRINL